jgi:8-oxo-dGTP diphosphatase
MIKGAGVVLWRERMPLSLEVALIHRPKYDDWTFPKGGVEIGEDLIQAAFRECIEETGIKPVIGPYIGEATYKESGEKKVVNYWMAREQAISHTFQANDEVDQLQWLGIKEARHFLTYDTDREILSKFVKLERHVKTLIFLRHAKAVKRDEWFGEDSDRPLAHLGQLQVAKLPMFFKPFGVEEVHTSDAQRCIGTAGPLAESLRVDCKVTPSLSEDVFEKDDNIAIEYIQQLVKFNKSSVVCSHNPIFHEMLLAFENSREFSKQLLSLKPAESWIVHFSGIRITAVDSISAPAIEGF